MKSTIVWYNSWHMGAGLEWIGKKSYWLKEEGIEGDGRAKRSSEIGDGGQAAMSIILDVDGTGSGSLLDSILSTLMKTGSSDVWVVAHSHLWKFATCRFICRQLNVYMNTKWELRVIGTIQEVQIKNSLWTGIIREGCVQVMCLDASHLNRWLQSQGSSIRQILIKDSFMTLGKTRYTNVTEMCGMRLNANS